MRAATECPIDRNMPERNFPVRRWAVGALYLAIFSVMATVLLLWALGYRVNASAGTVEQTSILELSSPQVGIRPQVLINNELQDASLPVVKRWLFPGNYEVVIQKAGYQTWEKIVQVKTNERVAYPSVILLYEKPEEMTAPQVRLDELNQELRISNGIEVRDGNELWIEGKFVTRTSKDIVSARWYGDDQHVIYQSGSELVMRDIRSETTQRVLALTSEQPVPFTLKENGRVLVFAEGETIKAVALYEPTSFLDRFTGAKRSSDQTPSY